MYARLQKGTNSHKSYIDKHERKNKISVKFYDYFSQAENDIFQTVNDEADQSCSSFDFNVECHGIDKDDF